MPLFNDLFKIGICLLPILGVTASPQSTQSPKCVHSAKNRQCWRDGFDINTDYDFKVPPGKLREYDFTISQKEIAPDGYKFLGTVINGQYPGPTIEADWGDIIRVTVHNNLTNVHNGTALHWHGIRMLETNWLDGVPGVTQCPSKPGESQVYEFRAMQYGTSWYHSHFSLQYTNGAYGPIVIHGPSSANYDEDLGPLVMSDWYHQDAFSLLVQEYTGEHAAIPESFVMNGKGVFPCDSKNDTRCIGKKERHELVFQRGKKYKFALVNSGSLLTIKFWIDGHKFTVINNDFVAVKPYTTDVLIVGIGQRYEIIVEANASFKQGPNFWIHANYCDDDTWESRLGIIRYDLRNKSDPYTPPISEQHYGFGCQDPKPTDLVPIVKRTIGRPVNGVSPADYLKIGLKNWPNVSDPNSIMHKWVLANKTMLLDWAEPTIKKLTLDKNQTFTEDYQPVLLDHPTGEWVYFVIINNYTLFPGSGRTIPRSVHPIHLHGHDLHVLAQGIGEFTPDIKPNLDNPSRRDVTNCPIGGYVWIAFRIDNPGAWLLHCHIAWHASSGLAVQFLEQPGKLKGLMNKANAFPEFERRCQDWKNYYETVNVPKNIVQDDSGV
ncbi:putative extracellular dihydrogeodin oxidase/laccase [Delitschia confertaspora ATCC 74209]|uniref:Extracellular dihydrogeodin oxidase/laccase n=1 Tax=Delitschia confertaspora ATCC 74209 TaxID=1513339 RepID=A0A9P4MVX8_9PLEO|nr:putative extracellular dihydrogeodin oxidase/laccase [Delitschia confertaspora ATCC 74209]